MEEEARPGRRRVSVSVSDVPCRFATDRCCISCWIGRAGPLVYHIERHYKDFCNGAAEMDDRTLLAAVAVP